MIQYIPPPIVASGNLSIFHWVLVIGDVHYWQYRNPVHGSCI